MVLLLLLLIPGVLQAQDAKTVLADAVKAKGAENLRTIQVTGSGRMPELDRIRIQVRHGRWFG